MKFSVVDNPDQSKFTVYDTKKAVGWGDKKKKSIECLPEYMQEISEVFSEYSVTVYTVKEIMMDFLRDLYGDGTEDEKTATDFWSSLIDDPRSNAGSILKSFMFASGK
jgi:hypothetical protein